MTALLAVSCGRKTGDGPTVSRFDGFTQGTTYHILVKSDGPLHMEKEIDSLLTEVDNSMSLYNPQSLLSRLNRNETDSVDGFIAECIRTARRISEQSDGAYDITVKPLTAAYGFTGDVPVQNPDVDSLLKLVGYDKIAVENGRLRKADPRMQIDLNSIAQGATSDYIAAYFEKLGIEEYMIEVGGEIFCRGLNAKGKPWVVGIDRPIETVRTIFHFIKRNTKDYPAGIVHFKSRDILLHSYNEETTDIDGQPGPRFPVRIACEPGALRVICPQKKPKK